MVTANNVFSYSLCDVFLLPTERIRLEAIIKMQNLERKLHELMQLRYALSSAELRLALAISPD